MMKKGKGLFNLTALMIAVLGMLCMFPQISNALPTVTDSCQVCHDPTVLHGTHTVASCADCHTPALPEEVPSSNCLECHMVAVEDLAVVHEPLDSSCVGCHAASADYSISGTVSGCDSCHALLPTGAAGVTITLDTVPPGTTPTTATTASDGTYSFTVSDGSYTVTPSLAIGDVSLMFDPESTDVTVSGADQTGVDFAAVGDEPPVEEDEIALEDYGLSIWDFSGTYTDERENNTLTYDLIQDAKGKVTGAGTLEGTINGVAITIPVEIKGTVKGKKDIVTLKYKAKGKDANGNKVNANIDQDLVETEGSPPELQGSQKRKSCIKGQGCTNLSSDYSSAVPDGMTGEAWIEIDATPIDANAKRTKYEGTAVLELSNEDEYPLSLKGKYTDKKDETQYQLKGVDASKGIKTKLKLDGRRIGPATFINGKALGQQLKFKQE